VEVEMLTKNAKIRKKIENCHLYEYVTFLNLAAIFSLDLESQSTKAGLGHYLGIIQNQQTNRSSSMNLTIFLA